MTNEYEIDGAVTRIWLPFRDGSLWECLIDTEDLPLVSSIKGHWYASRKADGERMYAFGSVGVLMHRFILGITDRKVEVDHIHHNGLDNRKGELRTATRSQNAFNRKGPRAGSRSGIRGVYWHKQSGYWRGVARVEGNKRKDICGAFETPEEAAEALRLFREAA
jgi:hypothetical protein